MAIRHPQSHASLARAFLAELCDDEDLLAMVQLHDEPYALFLQTQRTGRVDEARLVYLWKMISDWDLFIAFLIVDGCTPGKGREPLEWFLPQLAQRANFSFTVDDVLKEELNAGEL